MLKTTAVFGGRSLQRYKPPLQPRIVFASAACRQLSTGGGHGEQPPPPPGLEVWRNRIRGWSEQTTGSVKVHAESFALAANSAMSRLGSQLNGMTGYDAIEALKKRVEEQEALMHVCRSTARQAKAAYEAAIVQRSKSQREVNDLLQRKSMWTDSDVSRFTTLVREDHLKEQEEARAKASVAESEDAVDRQFSELMRSILARYHEEQIWSDKIRSASTYGSLAVLGLNLAVFLVAITVVEPWKRRRLAETLEKQIEDMGSRNAAVVEEGLKEIGRQLREQRGVLGEGVQVMLETLQEQQQKQHVVPSEAATDTGEVPRESSPKRDVGVAAAVGAITSGILGWIIHSWFST